MKMKEIGPRGGVACVPSIPPHLPLDPPMVAGVLGPRCQKRRQKIIWTKENEHLEDLEEGEEEEEKEIEEDT